MQLLDEALHLVLRRPSLDSLILFQEALLTWSGTADPALERYRARALDVAERFYNYLAHVQTTATAREYNQLASWLDIGALGMVAFDRLVTDEVDRLSELLPGIAAEALMAIASRQYVRAWDAEARKGDLAATWYLRQAFWRLSVDFQPDLSVEKRLEGVRGLLAPITAEELPPAGQFLLLGRLFQSLLQVYAGQLLVGDENRQS